MAQTPQASRQIALFVEGDTETGEARRRTLPRFIHRWLDPQLPEGQRVGITPVNFQGVSKYLDDLAKKVGLYLDDRRANFVVGLIEFLKHILGRYKKTTTAMNLFPKVDPQIAIDKCPYLRQFMEDVRRLAGLLQ